MFFRPWACPPAAKNLGFFDLGFEKCFFRLWACPPGAKKLGFFNLGFEKSFFRPWVCPPGAKNLGFFNLGFEKCFFWTFLRCESAFLSQQIRNRFVECKILPIRFEKVRTDSEPLNLNLLSRFDFKRFSEPGSPRICEPLATDSGFCPPCIRTYLDIFGDAPLGYLGRVPLGGAP